MMRTVYIKWIVVLFGVLLLHSCEEFIEIDAPNNLLIQKEVFSNDETARSAMDGIYNQLFLSEFSSGSTNSVTFLAGMSADNIQNISTSASERKQFEENEIISDNNNNLWLWSGGYNVIYMTNAFLEGIIDNRGITESNRAQLEGEARFVRAFTYFYLVNLYGDIPLITSTDYSDNQLADRSPEAEIQKLIVDDLEIAIALLSPEYFDRERTQVNLYAALSLLSRVYLFQENWDSAIELSSQVIESGNYHLLSDLNQVFKANNEEAIWQISPKGRGGMYSHTNEGRNFIIDPRYLFFASIKLREDFVQLFDDEDLRKSNWIGFNEEEDAFFAYKYKIFNSTDFPIEEYSMVLRLAEQYLIRAEAYIRNGDFEKALNDINTIRQRAGLPNISASNTSISQDELLDIVLNEKRKELFIEWGNRWLDLKRTGRTTQALSPIKPLWDSTDILYPIPEEERRKNPNLSQNEGY